MNSHIVPGVDAETRQRGAVDICAVAEPGMAVACECVAAAKRDGTPDSNCAISALR